jgi:hypothetical protein
MSRLFLQGKYVYPSGCNTYEQAIGYVIAMRIWVEPAAVALGVIAVIVIVVLFLGHGISSGTTIGAPSPEVLTPITPEPSERATPPPTTPEITPETTPTPPPASTERGTYAVIATPYTDKKYYKLPYRSTIYDPRASMPPVIFSQSYEGKFQSEAVVVHLVKSPLLIDYSLTSSQSPTRSFFYLTIRNNATQELLAQDGFLGPYSENRMKRLTFSIPGDYHINMYGGFVTVDLTLRAPTP